MKTSAAWLILGVLWIAVSLQGANDLGAFPPAAEGMARCVLQLPRQDDESSFRVELIVGKSVLVDEQNRYVYTGRMERETLDGWAYPFYVVRELGALAGTRMAPAPNAPRVTRFVTLGGEPFLIRYNSRLPIVIYVPQGAEVRYRLWTAGAETLPVEKG